jgi:hypothetical protein
MSDALPEMLSTAEFGDQRLTERFVTIVDRLSCKPNMSIPAAMNGRAEMVAAYRFFDNPKVTPEAIMAPHAAATLERIRQTNVALLVQDTTEVDVTRPAQQVAGAGPMDSEARCGAFYHPLFAFDASGIPLGTVWSTYWARDSIITDMTPEEKHKRTKQIPIEEKESYCWVRGIRAARDAAVACPGTQCVCISDSEGDIYEHFAEMQNRDEKADFHLLVRACQDRALVDCDDQHLLGAARATPCLYRYTVDISRRDAVTKVETRRRQMDRTARTAEVEVRATTVTLRPPYRPDRILPALTFNVVLVEEANPPPGEHAIQWILVTTLPIIDPEQVRLIVHYYSLRWQLEIYFKTLKSGCRIEARYFERMGRLMNCMAVYTIVAWKVFYLCRLSRECPDLSCEVIFEPEEWQPAYMTVRRRLPPKTPPTINEMTRLVASLGGYVIRKHSEPGTQTLWLGLQRLHDLATAWATFGPGTELAKKIYANTCV